MTVIVVFVFCVALLGFGSAAPTTTDMSIMNATSGDCKTQVMNLSKDLVPVFKCVQSVSGMNFEIEMAMCMATSSLETALTKLCMSGITEQQKECIGKKSRALDSMEPAIVDEIKKKCG